MSLYWTEWQATVTVRVDGVVVDKYVARRQCAKAAEASASMRNAVLREYEDATGLRVTVSGLKQLIWDRSS